MMYPKRDPVRSKKLRNHARDQSCVRCGANDGTVVLCHYTGLRQHQYGKGRGLKPDDHMAAELCVACHREMDTPQASKSVEASEEWLHLIALTWRRWLDDGVLTLPDLSSDGPQ